MSPKNTHVINKTEDISPLVHLRDILLTILLWMFFIYIVKESFTFLYEVGVWAAHGFRDFNSYTSLKIIYTFELYGEIILLLSAIFVAWALYNFLRFRKKTRRKFLPPVTQAEIADHYHFPVEDVATWEDAETMVMHHDKKGFLTKVELK